MPTSEDPDAGVLLDTHVWLWLVSGDRQLSRPARQASERAAPDRRVWVSAISAWEVGMLARKSRIQLGCDALEWVDMALAQPGISLVPLTPAIAVTSSDLPGAIEGDPADRILIATARTLGATLLTRDAVILRYGTTGHVKVLAA